MRQGALRTGMGIACVIAATILLVAGVGLCLWALYQWLAVAVGMPEAALLVGAALMVISGGLVWTAIRLSR